MATMTELMHIFWLNWCIAVISSQALTLTSVEMVGPCNGGLRSNTDTAILHATLNASGHDLTLEDKVSFQIRTGSDHFLSPCSVNLHEPCENTSSLPCYCSSKKGQVFNLIFILPAEGKTSHADARILWKTQDGFNSEFKLPAVYDVNATTVKVTVSDPLGNVTDLTGSCSHNLTVQLNHTLKFCCSNPGTACYPRILINKNIIGHDQPGCIFYTFKDVKFREASLEYSLCSQKSGIIQKVCETPETESSPSVEDVSYILWIMLGIAGPVTIIIIIVWMLRQKTDTINDSLRRMREHLLTRISGFRRNNQRALHNYRAASTASDVGDGDTMDTEL